MKKWRTRPKDLSPTEAARWDSWAATRNSGNSGYQPSPAEIDYLAQLARTDPEAFAQFESSWVPRTKNNRQRFLKFISRHRGKRLKCRQISKMSGCKLSYVKHAVKLLIDHGSPLVKRDGHFIEIL